MSLYNLSPWLKRSASDHHWPGSPVGSSQRPLAQSPAGAAQVQEFHRELFTNACGALREEIKRITGVEVREATVEVETATGTVVQVFTSGTTVQVYLLANSVPAGSWSGNGQGVKS